MAPRSMSLPTVTLLFALVVASVRARPLSTNGRSALEESDAQVAFPDIQQVLAFNGADEGLLSADPVVQADRTVAGDVAALDEAVASGRLGDPDMSKVTVWVLDLLRETSQRIAVGDFEKAAKKFFSPRAIVMPPEGPTQYLLSTFQKAMFLQSLSLTLPNVEFQPDGVSIYDLKYKTYKKYGMTITGTYVTSPSPLSPAAAPDNGKFVFYWDLLKDKELGADVAQFPLEGDAGENALRAAVEGASNNKYIWGVSWMIWNSDLPKDAPAPASKASSNFREAAEAATAVGWLDQVQDLHAVEAAAVGGAEGAVVGAASLADPRPQDIIFRIQTEWQGFSAALAAGDAAAATAIFAPVVTLMPPNQPRTMLVTLDQKQKFVQDLIDAGVTLSVIVEDVTLVELKKSTDPTMAGLSSSLSALVRSSYSKTTQKGKVAEMGKQVDLWLQNPMLPGQWYYAYSIWNSDGFVLPAGV